MAALLRRNTASLANVQVVESSLEDFGVDSTYDLLISADAWHWVDPDRRWQLCLDHLGPRGVVAVFSHVVVPTRIEQRNALAAALQPAPRRGGHTEVPAPPEETPPGPEMAAHPALVDQVSRHYERQRTVSIPDFIAQLSTESVFRILPADERDRLFSNVGDHLRASGLEVPIMIHTRLHMARRGLA